ncbi:hypothetical protein PMW_184 [Pseudomonas phage phiPMW]|uniref:Uncharacterized protein n=1 Tax=Pseudomonas phage phiPMW TaxID=1815582 RepID=A0A1S5R1N6_9CAUD|nr:hypothetical protein FDG97_gp166 [Pseudomonas phage phiPMW]ANA49309.1 hypothetical protein PMW_184 [Pseudomonas phage phiPMW]
MSEPVCVVRVGTAGYRRGDTYFIGRTLRTLKSKTTWDYLADEEQAVGVEDGLMNITNLDRVEDGLYDIVMTNIDRDYESGYIDGWSYTLYPHKED